MNDRSKMNSSLLQMGASVYSIGLYVLMTISTFKPENGVGHEYLYFFIIEMLYFANRCLLWLLSLLSLSSFPNYTFSVHKDWNIVIW